MDSELKMRGGIAFNAGNHSEVVKLAYEDFEALVKPKVESLAYYAAS